MKGGILLPALMLALVAVRPAGAMPPSVYVDELTWTEVSQALKHGYRTVIIPTGGTEQNGPHMALGKHNVIVGHAAGIIAEELGDALVAPVVAYVPEGSIEPPSGHMSFPGTISVPEPVFMAVVEHAARSFRAHGFTDIVLIGDSGGNLNGLNKVALALNEEWTGSGVRVHFIPEFTRGQAFRQWLMARGESEQAIGDHAGIMDTSVAMAVDPGLVRTDRLAPGGDFRRTGVIGDPRRATVDYGRRGLALQVDAAVAAIRERVGER